MILKLNRHGYDTAMWFLRDEYSEVAADDAMHPRQSDGRLVMETNRLANSVFCHDYS